MTIWRISHIWITHQNLIQSTWRVSYAGSIKLQLALSYPGGRLAATAPLYWESHHQWFTKYPASSVQLRQLTFRRILKLTFWSTTPQLLKIALRTPKIHLVLLLSTKQPSSSLTILVNTSRSLIIPCSSKHYTPYFSATFLCRPLSKSCSATLTWPHASSAVATDIRFS